MTKEEKYDAIQAIAAKFMLYQEKARNRGRPFATDIAFKQVMQVVTGSREWEKCLQLRGVNSSER